MKEPQKTKTAQPESQVVGLRLSTEFAQEFKAEAALRGLKLNDLFQEMWKNYLKSKQGRG